MQGCSSWRLYLARQNFRPYLLHFLRRNVLQICKKTSCPIVIYFMVLHLFLSDLFRSHSNHGFDIVLPFLFLKIESRLDFCTNVHYSMN